jgi:DNA-binding transcriptional regulator GbsR (MarR family)
LERERDVRDFELDRNLGSDEHQRSMATLTRRKAADKRPEDQGPESAEQIQVHRYDEFIESFASLMETRGIPRAAGRIFSFLQVSEPADQTAAQLANALGISLGTVSSMTRLLMRAGWVERISRRGERQAVFRTAAGMMTLAVDGVMEPTRRARELTDRGLALMADRPEAARARLQELNEVYRFFEEWFPMLLEHWHQRNQEDTK